MSLEIMPVRGVTKNYGVRRTGGAVGQYKAIGAVKSLSFKISGEFLADAEAGNAVLNTFAWEGITVTSAKLIVKSAFDATAAITFSTDTQGTLPIAATELGTVGVIDITPTGNLSVGSVTDATESFAYTGAVAGAVEGEAELYVEYIHTELP